MIQVCSRCGTRWNVRDRRRAWCPRCNGALWAPLTAAQEAELQYTQAQPQPGPGSGVPPHLPAPPAPPPAGAPQPAPRLGPGYRWIAVRPGPPPPPRRPRRPLGPTPRYSVIPRWTLMERVNPAAAPAKPGEQAGPSPQSVERALRIAAIALGAAAVLHTLIYLLMIINRTRLLHPLIAGAALWLGRLASVAAIVAVVVCAVRLTRWLIARRSAAFARQQLPESRPRWALRAGCLVPLVNLAWAPVYTLELAGREGRLAGLRKPIVVWWLVWSAATFAAVFATATSRAGDAQGIADNTVAMVFAYLLGLAAVRTVARVVEAFEHRSMGRPAHHWVVVAADRPAGATVTGVTEPAAGSSETTATPAAVLESDGREPAA